MSGIMTRWLVLEEHPVTGQDLDHDGAVSHETVERWVNAARLAYLDRCMLLKQEQAQSVHPRPALTPVSDSLG